MFHYTFVDIDKTIFDANAFKADMLAIAQRHNVSSSDFKETYIKAFVRDDTKGFDYTFDYTFEKHIALLEQRGYKLGGVLEQWNTLFDHDYLLPGVHELLEYVYKNSEQCILLTAGNQEFQMKKIESMHVSNYFTDIVVRYGNKEEYLESLHDSFEHSLFINDSLRESTLIHKMFPHMQVIVRFNASKYSEEEVQKSGLPYFVSLSDVLTYVKQLE